MQKMLYPLKPEPATKKRQKSRGFENRMRAGKRFPRFVLAKAAARSYVESIMRHSPAYILFLLLSVSAVRGDAFPVAPLAPVPTPEGGKVYRLQNTWMEVVVDPAAGGVVSIRHRDGDNLLEGPVTPLPAPGDLPYPLLSVETDDTRHPRWQSRGWITGDGTRVVMLTQTFRPPLHIRVSSMIQLPPEARRVHWNTRMTTLAVPDISPTPRLVWRPRMKGRLLWARHQDPPADPGEWVRSPPPLGTNMHPEIAVESHTLLALWKSKWHMEDGERLPSSLRDTRDSLICEPSLPDDLPPRGWTLVHDLVLTLHPLSEDQTAADLLPAR